MSQYGHFGRASWFVAGLSVLALLLHFAVPYGVVDYRGPAAPDSDVLWRGDVVEQHEIYEGQKVGNASPTVALAGLLLALFGSVILLVLGYQPLQVVAARWIGYAGGGLAALGAGLVWMSSMYPVGTGFATFLGTVLGTEFQANYWAISPVLVAATCVPLLLCAGTVMTTVVSSRDGLRSEAQAHLRSALLAMALMGTILLVPWSLGLQPDGVSDFLGFGDDEPAPLWFSAEDVQGVTAAEGADNGRPRYTREGDFGALSFSLHVLMGLSWTALVWHLLWPASAVAVSAGAPPRLLRTADAAVWFVVFMWAFAGVMYLLAWFLFKPDGRVEHTFLPGFWPVLVLGPAWLLLRRHLPVLRRFLSTDPSAAQATDLDA